MAQSRAAYRSYLHHTRSAALAVLQCPAGADDAAQRVLLRMLKRGGAAWDAVLDVGQYFRAAGRREALMMLREEAREMTTTRGLTEVADHPCLGPDPLECCIAAADRAQLLECVQRLPPRCSEVLLLAFNGRSRPEIAQELGVGLNAVEKQISRGYRLLRKRLA
jgi:RNA polymerase sigma factor (sigma-70 family)